LEQARKATDMFLKTRNVRPWIGSTQLLMAAGDQTTERRATLGVFREIRADDGSTLAYIADLKPRGFVAVSANTDIVPIVACSFRSSFPSDGDRDNPLYRLLTEDMKLRTKALAGRDPRTRSTNNDLWNIYTGGNPGEPAMEEFHQWPAENTTSTGGWLETAWHQNEPFNKLCPLDPVDGLRSHIGCAATALAQVLNYHKICNAHFDGDDSYTTLADMSLDADSDLYDFPSFEELNGYLADVQYKFENQIDLNDTDIAALSFASGVATQMDYSSKVSWTSPYDAHQALLEEFGFYCAEMTGGLSGEFHQVLQENMIDGLPALVAIAPTDSWGGHVVVCDGYNTDGEYHLNFGWGSPHPEDITEVWYHLPTDLMPDLSLVTETILNIQPVRPDIEVGPKYLIFYAAPGQESEIQAFKIDNNMGGTMIDSISCPTGFLMARWGEPFSGRIDHFELPGPESSTLVYVKFCPDQAMCYNGTLTVNYSGGHRKHVVLEGYSYTNGTEVPSGHVSGIWSQAESPYLVSGDIEVPEGSKLVIEPGVRVVFVGPYSMTIGTDATLTAEGSAAHPIEFTAWNTHVGWRGLRFLDSGSDDTLNFCSITLSRKNAGLVAGNDLSAEHDHTTDEPNNCGGAVYCLSSDVFITNCKINNNSGDNGGAIYCAESNLKISNTLIANNVSVGGEIQCGGIGTDMRSKPIVKNCTIVNNTPGGIFARSWEGMYMTNTIVWGNERYQILTRECTPTVSFCDIEGGYEGEGNIDVDPCFFEPTIGVGLDFDATSANWALRSCSPCINSGESTLLAPT
ncbi:MAG: C10 family peptidase, partial [Phycisphaerales bacterium]